MSELVKSWVIIVFRAVLSPLFLLALISIGADDLAVARASSAIVLPLGEKSIDRRQRKTGDGLRPVAAFAKAFGNLPDEVSLWSSKNIYGFQLYRRGRAVHGSFSLDAAEREQGKIGFDVHGRSEPPDHPKWRFGREDGVKVTQVMPDLYVVYFDRKAVLFRLNTPSNLPPGAVSIRGGEIYLGAIEDQTGLGFFVIRQEAARQYFFTLDEARLTEALMPVAVSGQIRVGARSGFAYYRDRYLPRWILIGVRKTYAAHDTLYDGPFDPPADVENITSPMAGGFARPYMLYESYEELSEFDQCAARAADPETYYRCFVRPPEAMNF